MSQPDKHKSPASNCVKEFFVNYLNKSLDFTQEKIYKPHDEGWVVHSIISLYLLGLHPCDEDGGMYYKALSQAYDTDLY